MSFFDPSGHGQNLCGFSAMAYVMDQMIDELGGAGTASRFPSPVLQSYLQQYPGRYTARIFIPRDVGGEKDRAIFAKIAFIELMRADPAPQPFYENMGASIVSMCATGTISVDNEFARTFITTNLEALRIAYRDFQVANPTQDRNHTLFMKHLKLNKPPLFAAAKELFLQHCAEATYDASETDLKYMAQQLNCFAAVTFGTGDIDLRTGGRGKLIFNNTRFHWQVASALPADVIRNLNAFRDRTLEADEAPPASAARAAAPPPGPPPVAPGMQLQLVDTGTFKGLQIIIPHNGDYLNRSKLRDLEWIVAQMAGVPDDKLNEALTSPPPFFDMQISGGQIVILLRNQIQDGSITRMINYSDRQYRNIIDIAAANYRLAVSTCDFKYTVPAGCSSEQKNRIRDAFRAELIAAYGSDYELVNFNPMFSTGNDIFVGIQYKTGPLTQAQVDRINAENRRIFENVLRATLGAGPAPPGPPSAPPVSPTRIPPPPPGPPPSGLMPTGSSLPPRFSSGRPPLPAGVPTVPPSRTPVAAHGYDLVLPISIADINRAKVVTGSRTDDAKAGRLILASLIDQNLPSLFAGRTYPSPYLITRPMIDSSNPPMIHVTIRRCDGKDLTDPEQIEVTKKIGEAMKKAVDNTPTARKDLPALSAAYKKLLSEEPPTPPPSFPTGPSWPSLPSV